MKIGCMKGKKKREDRSTFLSTNERRGESSKITHRTKNTRFFLFAREACNGKLNTHY